MPANKSTKVKDTLGSLPSPADKVRDRRSTEGAWAGGGHSSGSESATVGRMMPPELACSFVSAPASGARGRTKLIPGAWVGSTRGVKPDDRSRHRQFRLERVTDAATGGVHAA